MCVCVCVCVCEREGEGKVRTLNVRVRCVVYEWVHVWCDDIYPLGVVVVREVGGDGAENP